MAEGGISIKINLVFGAALVLLLSMFSLTYYNTSELITTTLKVDHSHRILRQLGLISAQLQDVDTHARNYLMFARPESRQLFTQSTKAVTEQLRLLEQLTQPYMVHQIRLNRIKKKLVPRLNTIQEQVEAPIRTIKPAELLRKQVLWFVGTPDTRQLLQDMQKTVLADLREQTNQKLDGAEYILYAILLGGILTMAIVGIAVLMLHRHIRARQEAEAQMTHIYQQNEKLVKFSHQLNQSLNLSECLSVFGEAIPNLFTAERFTLFLREGNIPRFKLVLHNHDREELQVGMAVIPGENSVMQAALNRQGLVLVSHFSTSGYQRATDQQNRYRTDAALCIPLMNEHQCLGLLNLNDFSLQLFNESQLMFVEQVVEHLTLALKNSLMHETVLELSIRDELTGLYNRRYLYQELAREIVRSSRYEDPLALLMFDIDHFKRINDTYGHAAGDEVLRIVSQIIGQNLRGSDVPCRYGGEEIAVILPNTVEADALQLAERIRNMLARHKIAYESIDLSITVSIGITAWQTTDGANQMLNRADQALYEAKAEGRNVCRLAV